MVNCNGVPELTKTPSHHNLQKGENYLETHGIGIIQIIPMIADIEM
jgi:hypothetical protein